MFYSHRVRWLRRVLVHRGNAGCACGEGLPGCAHRGFNIAQSADDPEFRRADARQSCRDRNRMIELGLLYLGQPDIPEKFFRMQLRQGFNRGFNRRVWIDAMKLEQTDVAGAKVHKGVVDLTGQSAR
ncbi:MAG: hypothetical protein AAFR68_22620 [Pseudomonadota bacterium]